VLPESREIGVVGHIKRGNVDSSCSPPPPLFSERSRFNNIPLKFLFTDHTFLLFSSVPFPNASPVNHWFFG